MNSGGIRGWGEAGQKTKKIGITELAVMEGAHKMAPEECSEAFNPQPKMLL